MALTKQLSSIKRFGARYGRTVKHRLAVIEHTMRNSTKCPYCNNEKVRRVSKGIWECGKCSSKFAGKAYTFTKRKTIKEMAEEVKAKEEKDKKQREAAREKEAEE